MIATTPNGVIRIYLMVLGESLEKHFELDTIRQLQSKPHVEG